jgi:hypothetical protein
MAEMLGRCFASERDGESFEMAHRRIEGISKVPVERGIGHRKASSQFNEETLNGQRLPGKIPDFLFVIHHWLLFALSHAGQLTRRMPGRYCRDEGRSHHWANA